MPSTQPLCRSFLTLGQEGSGLDQFSEAAHEAGSRQTIEKQQLATLAVRVAASLAHTELV
jgi:hypothetical protein